MITKRTAILIFASLIFAAASNAQEVVLDRQVRAGELTLFPSARNPNEYFYVADKSRLARDDNGNPQFSFLRYVEPSASADADSDKAAGGGIVHAVVELGVTDQQLAEARTELRRVNSSGTLVGPVTFKSGTFVLISSFADENSDLTDHVIGVGKSPLLENEKAAVSFALTRKGAEILWESFQTSTPDISFSFNMEIDGFRSPIEASIEADFEKIYQHQEFAAGVATPFLQAEIQGAFDDLRDNGAIKISQVGENEKMEALITTAYNKLTALMFDKADSSGTPSTSQLAAGAGGTDSMLTKASALLGTRRTETRGENDKIRARNDKKTTARSEAAAAQASSSDAEERIAAAQSGSEQINRRAAAATRIAERYRASAQAASNQEERSNYNGLAEHWEQQAASYQQIAGERNQEAESQRERMNTESAKSAAAQSRANDAGPDEEVEDLPSLAIVASYRIKKVHQRGKFNINLNKYTADTMSLRFDENIGDLSRFVDDTRYFNTFDITASAYRQREVPVLIDGLNVADFGSYINHVTVTMRKKHQNGSITSKEIRIDRENFQKSANNFKLVYAKLNDSDENNFLEYEYRVLWDFFGGAQVDEPWRSSIRSGITVVPPYQRRTVFVEGDPDAVAAANIRAVDVYLYYDVGGAEKNTRIPLQPKNGQGLSENMYFYQPADSYDYEYEMIWRLKDGTRIESGRRESTDARLYLEDIEEG